MYQKIDGTTVDNAEDLDLVIPIVQIIKKQHEVCGFILKMKETVLKQIMLIMINSNLLYLEKLKLMEKMEF